MKDLPIYRCRRIAGPIALDGDVTKPVWQEQEPIVLVSADGSGAAVQGTTARGCWDGKTLYLAYACVDRDIRATMRHRDDKVWMEEAVEAFIAPYGDLLHYWEFQCSPLAVVRDIRVTNHNTRGEPVDFDGSWDCPGWAAAARVDGRVNDPAYESRGWSAEWAIPLAAMLPPGAGPVQAGEEWRVNLFRIDRWPALEHSAWSPNPLTPLSFHRPQYFGRWVFEE